MSKTQNENSDKPINLVLLVDNSYEDSINTINDTVLKYIEIMKKKSIEFFNKSIITLSDFDYYIHKCFSNLPLNQFNPVNEDTLEKCQKGCISLNDGICMGILNYVVNVIDFKLALYHPDKENIIVIITNGLENTSSSYTHTTILQLVKFIEETEGKVIFIGTRLDVMEKGNDFRIT